MLQTLLKEKQQVEDILLKLKDASPQDRGKLLDLVSVVDGRIYWLDVPDDEVCDATDAGSKASSPPEEIQSLGPLQNWSENQPESTLSRSGTEPQQGKEPDLSPFLSVSEEGKVQAFGPVSSLHEDHATWPSKKRSRENTRHHLIANAALQRQQEYQLYLLNDFDGVPSELAMHLLDLHWSRQHHTFLLTYRPTFTRDLLCGGPYASKFLLNAIFASASKYSDRLEIRDDVSDSTTAGARFLRRCTSLLAEEALLAQSKVSTIAGLLLLGSNFVATGDVSRGWLYSGLAFRMVFDLGLHLDHIQADHTEEDVEIRQRLFWGAYVYDKLQSLYTGRPASLDLRHCSVSRDFLDTYEEYEIWSPYVDYKVIKQAANSTWVPTPIRSVSTFQHFCGLSELVARVIDRVYALDAHVSVTGTDLAELDDKLREWYVKLPDTLKFCSWNGDMTLTSQQAPPNILILNVMYQALIVLLHRPFLSDGHLRPLSHPADPWKKCTEAAANITGILMSYQNSHTLRRGPYILSYAAYVACTIHVRNASSAKSSPGSLFLTVTLNILRELSVPNPGVRTPLRIICGLLHKFSLEYLKGVFISITFGILPK